jgi:protein MpaA
MPLRSPAEAGHLNLLPESYGTSVLGRPLEFWRSSGPCRILIHAGIHGEEGETTVALSRALRLLDGPSPDCAVVLAANPDGLVRGTRSNARGVDLNRNFPTSDWRPEPVYNRSTLDAPRDVEFSPGSAPGSEPEVSALIGLIEELRPEVVVALHAPLACIDSLSPGPLAHWLADRTGMELVTDVGYPTPGSFGTWGAENGVGVVTYEFPLTHNDDLVKNHVPVLAEILTGDASWS